MLSRHLFDRLRAWWKVARPQGWLFPGRDPVQPLTTRQLNRGCHAAAQMAEIDKPVSLHTLRRDFATHLLEHFAPYRALGATSAGGSAQRPIRRGYAAHQAGPSPVDNPYPPHTIDRLAWE